MLGYIAYHGGETPPMRVIEGVRFRMAYVRRGDGLAARLSARAAARLLRRGGVRYAVFPPGYPHRALFAAYGVTPPPLTPLYHACAAEIVRRYASRRGLDLRRDAVAFAAGSVSPELRRAVWELSEDARYIVLHIPAGGEELARRLRRERGVAARVAAPGEIVPAALTVCFEPCGMSENGEMLPLYSPELAVGFADGMDEELRAALFLAGALDASALRVECVEKRTKNNIFSLPSSL